MPEIDALITKVEKEEDTGWGTISTDHPDVKKLTTRIAEKITEAASFKRAGERVRISYTEKTRTVPATDDLPPRTFRNFYYERATALASSNGAKADDGIDIIPRAAGKEDPDRSWRICLQSGGKLAVATLPLMPIEQRDFETQKTIARAWAEFFHFTPRPEAPRQAQQQTVLTGPGAYSEPGEQPPPYTDDDIPY